jgi:hypothetical protein
VERVECPKDMEVRPVFKKQTCWYEYIWFDVEEIPSDVKIMAVELYLFISVTDNHHNSVRVK